MLRLRLLLIFAPVFVCLKEVRVAEGTHESRTDHPHRAKFVESVSAPDSRGVIVTGNDTVFGDDKLWAGGTNCEPKTKLQVFRVPNLLLVQKYPSPL